MTPLTREAKRLASAVQFLTRVPVPDPGWEPDRARAALRYFGAVGAAVGAGSALVWLAAGAVLPPAVAAGLALAGGIWVTGALHEDGLADCADALGAPVDRARRLEILKDSRIGTFGTLALIVALGLRWASLAALAPALGALGLVLAAAAGRGAIAIVARAGRPARTEGLAAALAPGPRGVEIAGAAVPALAIAIWGGVPAMVALALAAVLGAAVFVLATRRLGGYTGDVFGAVAVSVETAVLVGLAAWA